MTQMLKQALPRRHDHRHQKLRGRALATEVILTRREVSAKWMVSPTYMGEDIRTVLLKLERKTPGIFG